MTLNVFDKRNAIAIFIARHREVGDKDVRVKLWQVIDQCCGIFELTDNVHPLDLFKRLTNAEQNNRMVIGNNYVHIVHVLGYLATASF